MAYVTGRREDVMSTISSKNQITLPVQLLRELGIGPGDRLAVSREGDTLVLRARPKDWVAYHAGSLAGVYGKDPQEINAHIEELRRDEERDERIERAWTGREPANQ